MLCHQGTELVYGGSALPGDARQLEFRRSGCNVRIESRCRPGNQVDGHGGSGIFSLSTGYVPFHPVNQFLVCGSELRAIRICSVISVTREGRPGMKIRGTRKALPDDAGPDRLPILLNELAVCLLRKH